MIRRPLPEPVVNAREDAADGHDVCGGFGRAANDMPGIEGGAGAPEAEADEGATMSPPAARRPWRGLSSRITIGQSRWNGSSAAGDQTWPRYPALGS